MINKIIHYCWFGQNPLPNDAMAYIDSWKKYFPDYDIKEWNESNYDVYKIPYTTEAYNAKKYAFVSDYARFDILYQYGGIYFDVDVEVIKPFGKILEDTAFIGTEAVGLVAAGLGIGCNAGLSVVKEILDDYAKDSFLCNDGIHEYNLKTVVWRFTEILIKKGFNAKNNELQKIAEFTIYPTEFFCPKDFVTGKLKITERTVSIHHYAGSWVPKEQKRLINKRYKIYKLFGVNYFSNRLIRIMGSISRRLTILSKLFRKL
ncbi:glycosyl transferase [Fibrobacteres bacterium R8-0-B4]